MISTAKTKVRYNPADSHMIAFPMHADVRVYAKAENAWRIEVQGRSGWAPPSMLAESKIHVKKADLIEVHAAVVKAVEEVSVEKTAEEVQVPVEKAAEEATVDVTVDKNEAETTEIHVEPKQPEPEPAEKNTSYEYSYEYVTGGEPSADTTVNETIAVETSEQTVVSEATVTEKPVIVDVAPEQPKVATEQPSVAEEQPTDSPDGLVQTHEKVTEEELDEDDVMAAGEPELKPIDEPLFVKKDVYKVGEEPTDQNAHIKLEIIGIEANIPGDKADEDKPVDNTDADKVEDSVDASYVDSSLYDSNDEQSSAPILAKVEEAVESVRPASEEEQKSDEGEKITKEAASLADKEEVVPSADKIEAVSSADKKEDAPVNPITANEELPAVLEAETKKEFTETVLPSATIELGAHEASQKPVETVTPAPDLQPSFGAQKTVIDGTTLPDFENDPILTTANDVKPSESEGRKTATITPTPSIVQSDHLGTAETPKLDSEQFTTTVDAPKGLESLVSVADTTLYDSDYLQTAASTFAESHANHIDATVIVREPEELTEAPVPAEQPVKTETEGTDSQINEKTEVDEQKPNSHHENPSGQLKDSIESKPLESAPVKLDEPVKLNEAAKLNEPSPAIALEPTSTELNDAPAAEEILQGPVESSRVGEVEKVHLREEEPVVAVDSDDIFSPNYVPKAESVAQPPADASVVDDSNFYDSILVAVEDVFSSLASLFTFGSKETEPNQEKTPDEIEEKTPDAPNTDNVNVDGYCERLDGNACPTADKIVPKTHYHEAIFEVNYARFVNDFFSKVVELAGLVMCLAIAGACILLFLFGQECLVNRSREAELIQNLNIIERKLLATQKECGIATADLLETRKKLSSIADKSFGADDMIRQCEAEKAELQAQIETLEKELETSVEAGLELNKMVSDLLNNQSGSDSLISSVEELQHQLNEQEAATVYINNLLAEKSRENSELQILLSESNNKFGAEIEKLMKENEELQTGSEAVESELKENIEHLQLRLNTDVEEKSAALEARTRELEELTTKYEEIVSRWQISMARADAFEDSLTKLKHLSGKEDVRAVIEITNGNAKLLATERENESLKEKVEADSYAQNRLNEQIKSLTEEVNRMRAEFTQNEKDKLEAQTRLDVLSSYFKDKEAQLQK